MFSERIVRAPSFTGFLLVQSSRKWSDDPDSSPLTGSTTLLPRGSLCAVSSHQLLLTFFSAVLGFLQNSCCCCLFNIMHFVKPLRQFNLSPKPEANGGRVSSFCSVAKSCPTLWDPMDCSTPGSSQSSLSPSLCPLNQWCIQSSHPLLPSFPFAFYLSQHQGLFQCVISSHQVAKLLELQLQHQSFQWMFSVDFLKDWLVWSPSSPRDFQESSSTTVQKHQFFGIQLSLWSNSTLSLHYLKKKKLAKLYLFDCTRS